MQDTSAQSDFERLRGIGQFEMIRKILHYGLMIGLFGLVIFLVDLYRNRDMPRQPALPEVLQTITGDTVDLAALSRQQPVLIYFWATWCGPCKATSPTVQWLSRYYRVVTVAIDSGSDSEISAYLQKNGYDFPVINGDPYPLSEAFGVKVTPTLVVYRNARVSSSTVGVSTPWGLWLRLIFA